LEITKLAFLSGPKPPLSHVPLTSRLGSDGPAKVAGPLLRVQGVRARAVWYPHPDDPPQG
jgi:hypothetical protein